MLQVGTQLYQLGQRDIEGVLLEQYSRTTGVTVLLAAANTGTATITLPRDRLLYLHSFSIGLTDNTATSRWTNILLRMRDQDFGTNQATLYWAGNGSPIRGDTADTAAAGLALTVNRGIIVPPRCDLVMQCTRNDATLPANFTWSINGVLLPMGTWSRGLL